MIYVTIPEKTTLELIENLLKNLTNGKDIKEWLNYYEYSLKHGYLFALNRNVVAVLYAVKDDYYQKIRTYNNDELYQVLKSFN